MDQFEDQFLADNPDTLGLSFEEDAKFFDAEAGHEPDFLHPAPVEESIYTDDPVRVYLREMGAVPLLTREGEVDLARRMERGKLRMQKAISRSALVQGVVVELSESLKKGSIELENVVDLGDVEEGTPADVKVRAEASFINHPDVTVGFRFNTSTGSIAYLPDHESCFRMRSLSTAQGPVAPEQLAFARREDEKTLRFIHGVDLLILDAQYDVEEYRSRVGWGHSCVDDTVELASRAQAKKLFLFHHDPSHDDDKIDLMVAHARELAAWHGHKLEVEAAREGLLVPIEAPEHVP